MSLTLAHRHLGRADYLSTWELQKRLRGELLADRDGTDDVLLTVEHPPVLTAGKRAKDANLRVGREALAARGVEAVSIERGGDWTYHGPGQLVAYPIIDLRRLRLGARDFVGALQDVMLALTEHVLEQAGVGGHVRLDVRCDAPGAWFFREDGHSAKLGAVGVHISHGATMHGLALNLDPYPWGFDWIVPCGLDGEETSSLARLVAELGGDVDAVPSVDAAAEWLASVLPGTLEARRPRC